MSNGLIPIQLEHLASDPKTTAIQISEPIGEKEADLLENLVFSRRPDILFRVYGHYSSKCDLRFLKRIPSIQKLSVDCLMKASGIEVVTEFKALEKLAVGVFELDNFNFLDDIDPNLKELNLYGTRSKKPRLDAVRRFTQLEKLYLEGQYKGIEVINDLKKLQKIVLRSISTTDVNYLSGLEHLWSVDVKLGGIKNFDALTSLPNLKYLELWQVRELADITFISDLKKLQNLFLQSLPNVTHLPNLKRLTRLRRICLENLKNLQDVSSLRTAPALKEFIYVLAQNQQPENLLPALENMNVDSVCCMFGSDKKNNRFVELTIQYGKRQFKYEEFKYE